MAKKIMFPDGVGGVVWDNGDYGNGKDTEFDLYMYVSCGSDSIRGIIRTLVHKRGGNWYWKNWDDDELIELPEM